MDVVNINNQSKNSLDAVSRSKLFNIYKQIPYTSIKIDSYFLKLVFFMEAYYLCGKSILVFRQE